MIPDPSMKYSGNADAEDGLTKHCSFSELVQIRLRLGAVVASTKEA